MTSTSLTASSPPSRPKLPTFRSSKVPILASCHPSWSTGPTIPETPQPTPIGTLTSGPSSSASSKYAAQTGESVGTRSASHSVSIHTAATRPIRAPRRRARKPAHPAPRHTIMSSLPPSPAGVCSITSRSAAHRGEIIRLSERHHARNVLQLAHNAQEARRLHHWSHEQSLKVGHITAPTTTETLKHSTHNPRSTTPFRPSKLVSALCSTPKKSCTVATITTFPIRDRHLLLPQARLPYRRRLASPTMPSDASTTSFAPLSSNVLSCETRNPQYGSESKTKGRQQTSISQTSSANAAFFKSPWHGGPPWLSNRLKSARMQLQPPPASALPKRGSVGAPRLTRISKDGA